MNPLNTYLDHTLLKADATRADILAVTAEAKAYKTASVCVTPAIPRWFHASFRAAA